MSTVHIIGSGVAGLSCAYVMQQAGFSVQISTASHGPDESCCSWWAGGMLAPFCEQESAEPLIGKLGLQSMAFWRELAANAGLNYHANGTLVVATARDQSLMRTFERQTEQGQWLDQPQLAELEPALGHFSNGLFYQDEAHIEPRAAIQLLWQSLAAAGVQTETDVVLSDDELAQYAEQSDWLIDCRGLAAQGALPDLRGVKGEMLHIYSEEVKLTRPIRLLHPRYPLYIVPRPDQQFMVGATMIEANYGQRATVRSMLELLSAAYALHPAFAEAEVIEMGVDLRPAFDDNLPRVRRYGNTIYVNGLYRHGFLAAPAMAHRVLDLVLDKSICHEVIDANYPERRHHRVAANHA